MTSLISLKASVPVREPLAHGEVCLSKITSDKNADDFESKTKDYGCLKMSRQVTHQFHELCIMVINHLENAVVISLFQEDFPKKTFLTPPY